MSTITLEAPSGRSHQVPASTSQHDAFRATSNHFAGAMRPFTWRFHCRVNFTWTRPDGRRLTDERDAFMVFVWDGNGNQIRQCALIPEYGECPPGADGTFCGASAGPVNIRLDVA